MVVVAIVAIIAAVAYPSFQNGLQHSRRADAFKTLLTMQLKQEEFRISNAEYSKNVADLGNPNSSYYSFSVVAASTGAATYKLQAQAIGAQSSDSGCTLLTITKADVKSPPDCWN